ncbi:hypothetical protein PLESTB_000307600 [Pleodorina starrii]|uniref:Sugar phosphate transporter domain-containing protein n=1 Tax=Pleodorina starrii TaxID=330485 RepID=A0A9W6BDV1_9CHLO|nr:hypothetical protein PLESTM_001718200 [Pleodorina starrii]GLC49777.1 hypothetical protein PLESTB_000307600 [Pleodorina starrii]GLC76262.1 hypothetical protein PLESTF_001756700 [Pleodorina starrii]
MWLGLSIAIFYGAVAVFANFVNKYAVQVLPLPTTILLAQTLTTVILLRAMAALQFIRVPPLRSVRARQLASLSICYSVHAVLVLYSLAFLSVPMYNTLKRLTPVMVLITKAVVDRRWPDAQTTSSVLLIVSGCMVAGAGDLSFDGQGYALALLCAFMQAAYILLAEKASGGGGGGGGGGAGLSVQRRKYHASGNDLADVESSKVGEVGQGCYEGGVKQAQDQAHSTGIVVHAKLHLNANVASSRASPSQFLASPPSPGPVQAFPGPGISSGSEQAAAPLSATELLYSICVISVPALTAVCLISGEGARAPALLEGLRLSMGLPGFTVWLGITAITEGLLTGSVILCTQMNSALTTAIVGVLKGAVSSVLGFFLLGGVKFHVVNVAGITMNMVGGIWYSGIQYLRRKTAA